MKANKNYYKLKIAEKIFNFNIIHRFKDIFTLYSLKN